MAYSASLCDSLRTVFDQCSIRAAFEDKEQHGQFTIQMKLRCKLQTARMFVIVRNDSFSTLTTIPLAADETCRLAVAEYLTRVNFNMRNGNFELNMENGEIRFKTYMSATGDLDMAGARVAVLLPFFMLEHYGNGLLEVLFGFRSPKEAYDALPTTISTPPISPAS